MHEPAPLADPASLAPGLVRGIGANERTPHWRPGFATGCMLSELFASGHDAAGAGLALALAQDTLRMATPDPAADIPDHRPFLWVQDKAALRLSGRPYLPGLPSEIRHRLIHVAANTPEDALFALEEGLRCRDLAFVIGEIAGNPRALDFTASRRLGLAAEKHGVPLWLIRLGAKHDLGAARMRWRVEAAPSPPPRWNTHAPGAATWTAELFRAHTYQPGKWILRDDGPALVAQPCINPATPDHGYMVHRTGDRSLAAI